MPAKPDPHYLKSAHNPAQFLPDTGQEVAFAGRSNAGKSSALNVIANRSNLARTSKTPGRTQLVNFFHWTDDTRLVDLPGYGYAKVPEAVRRHWRGLMQAYFESRGSLSGLVLVMDARRPLLEFDVQMLSWAQYSECPVHVLLTKADKLSRGAGSAVLHKVRREIGDEVSVQLFSALKRTGVDEARDALGQLLCARDGTEA